MRAVKLGAYRGFENTFVLFSDILYFCFTLMEKMFDVNVLWHNYLITIVCVTYPSLICHFYCVRYCSSEHPDAK
jgi:hypothetical protein